MEITIIGSGNVAAALAGAVAGQDSLHLKQLCARNPLRGRELADRYGAEYIARPEETAEADLYLIAVSDSAVEEVSARLRTPPIRQMGEAGYGSRKKDPAGVQRLVKEP